MENRENVIADYFKLRVLLNKTTLRSNEKTDIEFRILRRNLNSLDFVATLRGTRDAKIITLCTKLGDFRWASSGHSGLFHLEDFCADSLKKNLSRNPDNMEMNRAIVQISEELRSLGISF